MAGAAVAFETVERLIFLACSRTLDFASNIDDDDPAALDTHRTKVAVVFGAFCTRILVAGRVMITFLKSQMILSAMRGGNEGKKGDGMEREACGVRPKVPGTNFFYTRV